MSNAEPTGASHGEPTDAELEWAVGTSAAIDAAHSAHAPCRDAVRALRPALAGHAAFEAYSVLTRLPGNLTVDPSDAAALVDRVFPSVLAATPINIDRPHLLRKTDVRRPS